MPFFTIRKRATCEPHISAYQWLPIYTVRTLPWRGRSGTTFCYMYRKATGLPLPIALNLVVLRICIGALNFSPVQFHKPAPLKTFKTSAHLFAIHARIWISDDFRPSRMYIIEIANHLLSIYTLEQL